MRHPHPYPFRRRSSRATFYAATTKGARIPPLKDPRRPVHLRLDAAVCKEVERIAGTEPGLLHDGRPSLSAALRRLVNEALEARTQPTIPINPNGLTWIDAQATANDRTREEEVRQLLREAKEARERR